MKLLILRGGGRLPNKGRYGCAASAKPRSETVSPKNLMPGQKSAQKPNDWASFHDFWSAKLENFQQVGHFLTLLSNITHFFVKNCQKPNAWAKFTSQNLMPGQKLTPEIPNAQACTSIPTFIRELPPPPPPPSTHFKGLNSCIVFFVECNNINFCNAVWHRCQVSIFWLETPAFRLNLQLSSRASKISS